MKRVFGLKKDKEPTPSLQDASDRYTKRGDNIEEKIKKLDTELERYREQIKKIRPGPAQEAVKARAMRIIKQKRTYEGQRDMLYNRTFKLDQVAFAAEGVKNAQQTMSALYSDNKELKGMMEDSKKIQDRDIRNNIYGDDVKLALQRMQKEGMEEDAAYILMQRIFPTASPAILMGEGVSHKENIISELGVYATYLRSKEKVIVNDHSGYLMRTKVSSSNEGGVAAGFAVLDSIYLV